MPSTRFETGTSLANFSLESAAVAKRSPASSKAKFSTPNYYLGSPSNPLNLVLATVPGEGIHLYEVAVQLCFVLIRRAFLDIAISTTELLAGPQ